jgi:hypothetical protein
MNKTRNTLHETIRAQSVELLNKHLAAAIDLHAQTKQAHWNVRGPNFIAIHELFDRVSEQVETYSDMLAERAGGLGGVAPAVAEGKNTSSVGAGWFGLAAHFAQQRIRQRLLCLDFAKLGAGAIYSLPWPDSMARLAMALCFAGLFDAPFVFSSPH